MLRRKKARRALRPAIDALERRTLLSAPFVTAHSPLNGQQNVAVASNLTVTFNEALLSSSVTSTNFEVRNFNNTLLPATVTYNPSNFTVTIDPTANLVVDGRFHYVKVKSGPAGVRDLAGNAMESDFIFGFTTSTPTFSETTIWSNLTQPTAVRFSPDGRVFVAEKRGIIKVFDSLSDTTPDIFADLRTNVHNYWDRGLLGLALHPNFPATPHVFVLYTYDGDIGGPAPKWGTVNGDSDPGGSSPTGTGVNVAGRLSRLTAAGNVMTGQEVVLIEDWPNQFPSHSIGDLAFGPDGYLYASSGDGASFGFVDYGQVGNPFNDPPNEGGALRSLDVLSTSDPTQLDGTIIRIDPNTGAAAPGNPFTGDANRRRVISFGLRNPFRMTFRPGTSEIWSGDVGWNEWEEINRTINPADSTVENFGWPAYEGPNRQPGYDNANLPLIENLYTAGASAHTVPYYAYRHSEKVVPGSSEPTGSSAITGLAFYNGGAYPSVYDGALFFADYSRRFIYVMYRGPNGLPDPATRQVFRNNSGAVQLVTGPNGDLFWIDLNGAVRRFTYSSTNSAPTAVITSDVTGGAPPLTVNFSGLSSTDPDAGDILTYAWDLDADGDFDDSTLASPSWTYTTPGSYNVRLRVTDRGGLTSVASRLINVNNTAPVPTIGTPASSTLWRVGQSINFSGSATDNEDGTLPSSAFTWSLILVHGNELDPTNTHEHFIQSWTGVTSGSFIAPDHEYPSWLELTLTVRDSGNLTSSVTRRIDPQTIQLTLASNPPGMQLSLNGSAGTAPFTKTVIAGSNNSLGAPVSQWLGSTGYLFSSWTHGGASSQGIVAPLVNTTYTANYVLNPQQPYGGSLHSIPGLIEAEDFDAGPMGTAYFDDSPGNTGGAYRTTNADIEVCWDEFGGDYNLGWLQIGEWYEYTANITAGDYYTIEARVASAAPGGVFHIEVDGLDVSGFVAVPGTGGWQDWVTVSIPGVYLNAGIRVIRFEVDAVNSIGAFGNLNYLRFAREGQAPLPPSSLTASATLPNRVELGWIDNAVNESGYVVERRTGAGSWSILANLPANAVAYVDTTTSGGTTYSYRVRATNAAGSSAFSNVATVSTPVTGQSPFLGVPFAIPGTIQAEDFDLGGQGFAWFDWNTANNGGAYRATEVDIEPTFDTGGGFNVGWMDPGEWLEYTISVATAGFYRLDARVASPTTGGSFHLELNGADITGPISIPATGGYQTFQTISRSGVPLPAGIHVLRFSVDTAATFGAMGNLNWLRFFAENNAPNAPTGLVAAAGAARIALGWVDNSNNESGFRVERRTGAGAWALLANVAADATTFVDNTPVAGTTYGYRVLASNSSGNSPFSNEVTIVAATPLPAPIVRADFNEATGTLARSHGSASLRFNRTTSTPAWSTNVPATVGGASSLDFGTTAGSFAAETDGPVPQLAGLPRFTITGWLNNRAAVEGSGGNRVVSWLSGGTAGVDLVYRSDGSLQLGINQAAASSAARSVASRIPTSASADAGNWRFFAVTYDSTLASGHVRFSFGSGTVDATADAAITYSRSTVGASAGALSIGHLNSVSRSSAPDAMFRGLIDGVQIFPAVLTQPQIVAVQRGTGVASATGNGLAGQYFNNADLTLPVLTRTDAQVNFDWGTGAPAAGVDPDTFSVVWTGRVLADFTQTTRFHTLTDDGVKLWVNDQLLVDKWLVHPPTEYTGDIQLTAGCFYDIRMEFFDNFIGAVAKLSWSGLHSALGVIPTANLFSGSAVAGAAPPPVGGSVAERSILPSGDATVASAPVQGIASGTSRSLVLMNSDAASSESYLRFDLSQVGAIDSARLRLFGRLAQLSSSGVAVGIYASGGSWKENRLNWSTRPAVREGLLGTFRMKRAVDRWYEVDLTQFLRREQKLGRNVITLNLKNLTKGSLAPVFNSRDAWTGRPELRISEGPTAR
jgi:glucose/arabinose dehydrogenase/PKD repeat protein